MGRNESLSKQTLSQYFVNDSPTIFDQISTTQPPQPTMNEKNNLMSSQFSGSFEKTDHLLIEDETNVEVSEEVRNFWKPTVPVIEATSKHSIPRIQTPNELPDVIAEAVTKHLDEVDLQQRAILTINDVTQDERGLRNLIAGGCYRSAVNLAGRLLTIYGQGYGFSGLPPKHTNHSLQIWFTRLSLLVKLGEYDLLRAEAEPFKDLNQPDIFYEFYPEIYAGKKGSIASFSFRLLLAELPVYLGNPTQALDYLSDLFITSSQIKNHFVRQNLKPAVDFWHMREMRILYSIVNCAIIMKKYALIDNIMHIIIFDCGEMSKEERRILYSAWGRIYLQIGDVFGAEQKFAESRRLRDINSAPDLRDLVDKGLITVSKNDFPEAYAIFQKALHLESGNTMILNNMGVCLLYAGKLKESIHLFERAIKLNPQKSLNESLLVNLSTLYELESNSSKHKKLNLLRLINKYKPDLNISLEICLKLQPPS